jgi:hypothetical protein
VLRMPLPDRGRLPHNGAMGDFWSEPNHDTSADDLRCRRAVLVEGESDRAALEMLARRRGRVLDEEGVSIVPMGGVTNIRRYLDRYGPAGLNLRLAGLCDAGAEGYFRARLERAGLGAAPSRGAMGELGFFVCDEDLEDELIRALGPDAVEGIIESQGELPSLRLLQKQPAQRLRSAHDQLHRFMGSRSQRKEHYARLMVAELDLARMPAALDAVLSFV